MDRSKIVRGFTLIELLIVVAIVAILSGIALVNFQEAGIRSKTSRVKNDLRVISAAIHQYALDNQGLPLSTVGVGYESRLNPLTTPVAYLSTVPADPFFPPENPLYYYVNLKAIEDLARIPWDPERTRSWFVASAGPDRRYNGWILGEASSAQTDYDSTNGSSSYGDIFRFDDNKNSISVPLQ